MASSYKVKRTIAAGPDRIWALLTEPAGYAAWNPAVVSLEGRIAVGETVKLVSTVNPKRTFSLKVTELQGPRRMVWSDGMPLGLFKGIRTYSLNPTPGGTDFEMEEVYSGPLAPLITRAIPDLTDSFAQFADGLKAASEAPGGNE
jgi:hypothetical protein